MAKTFMSLNFVGKIFANGVCALSGFDLSVREGEILTLLGPSGCGKSTVLRLIAGLTAPSTGAILWQTPRARENIGFVFQDATLLPWASVFDNVFLPLRLAGLQRDQAAPRVTEALARVGLSRFEQALPRELSGGMKMRCAIARALVTKPALLLMDEPFAALDEPARFELNDDLLALKRELGTTIVFVTHSIYEAAYLSTRIVVLAARGGAIVDEIHVEPGPRGPAFRASAQFSEICRRASRALEGAKVEALA